MGMNEHNYITSTNFLHNVLLYNHNKPCILSSDSSPDPAGRKVGKAKRGLNHLSH